MDSKALWKWLILIVLVAGSVTSVMLLGIRLGLDLKGGMSFTVEMDEAGTKQLIREENKDLSDEEVEALLPRRMRDAQERTLEVLRNRIDGLGIAEPSIYPEKGNRIIVQLPGITAAQRADAEKCIRDAAFLEFRMVHEKNSELTRKQLFDRGLAPDGYKIIVVEGRDFYQRDPRNTNVMDQAYRERLGRFQAPHGYEFLLEEKKLREQVVYEPVFVERKRQFTGDLLEDAGIDVRPTTGESAVTLRFNAQGAKRFYTITSDYAPNGAKNPTDIGRQLAIVLDGSLYSAPVIREAIRGGRAEITGNFSMSEARLLSNILKAGALPVPVKVVAVQQVDPTLGRDSIRSGLSASLWGCLTIIVLMAAYYRINGLLADFALVLNLVLLPLGMIVVAGFLGVFSSEARTGARIALPVLTLPGIAGIALSLGMAVDANVLIFERIREELRFGKGFVNAIQAGFDRAFTAIFDSNITTIITAAILFIWGSGPVRGYAVTLAAGLIVSLYTAVLVTRMCYNAVSARTANPAVLKMGSILQDPKYDFMSKWKIAVAVSVVVIAGSWAVMIGHGVKSAGSVLAIDFTGGTSVTLEVAQKPEVEAVRNALETAGIKGATIQYQTAEDASGDRLQVKLGKGEVAGSGIVGKTLEQAFPAAGFKMLQETDVGPQIGGEMKKKALWAMLLSLAAMILYISIRFEFGFALGAVVALFHDVLITAGLTHVLGFPISMTVVAALLTIVGYSVNDTIVIFDRVRENLRLVPNKSFLEICNLSMNQTLSRTILTNFLTLVSVLFLVVLGGGAIKDFAVPMFIGMIAGTYSTMYIATPIVLLYHRSQRPDMGRAAVK